MRKICKRFVKEHKIFVKEPHKNSKLKLVFHNESCLKIIVTEL